MLLIEIAAQGVKGISPAGGSTRLRPGYNLVPFEGAALRRLLEALFYPAPRDGEALRAASAGSGPIRAGVTLLGNDGVTWRLVRDFAAGCHLQRLDPQRRAFTLVAQTPEEVAAVLREQVGVPARGHLALLSLAAGDLPSRRSAGLPPQAPQAAVRRPLAGAEAQKRLAELRAELARAERAEQLQYQFDGLQSRLFKAEEALREGGRLREAAQSAEVAVGASGPAAAVAEALGDVEAKLAAHARAVARRDEALAKLECDRAALEEEAARGRPRPFWLAPRFWAGAGVGAGALAVGLWGGAGQARALRYVALLDIPAFAWAAWTALDWVGALEAHGRLQRRRTLLDEHERKALESFERESAEVRQAFQALGIASVEELQAALNRVADTRAVAEEARRKLAEFEGSAATRSAEQDRVQVETELRQVEQALSAEAGGYVRDPSSVEMELQRVQAEADAPIPALGPEPEPPEVARAAEPAAADPLREVLECAGRELGVSPAAAARDAQVRASHVLGVLSANRLSDLSVDDRGNLLVHRSGQPIAAAALPLTDRDLVFLSLKLALIERALAGGKLVAVADDAFAGLPETARRLAGRLLRQLARPGQLLHATADVAFRESADHVA